MYRGELAVVTVAVWLVLSPVAAAAGYGEAPARGSVDDSTVDSRDVAGVGEAVDAETSGVDGRPWDVSAGHGRAEPGTVAAYRHLWPRSDATASLAVDNQTFAVSVAPDETYLHVNDDDAGRTEPINLTARDVQPGDRIRLTRLGEFEDGAAGQGMHAVFSTNATLRSGDARHRVPGAINVSRNHTTSATYYGSEPTDIPEDFLIADNAGEQTNVTVTVPAGAEYLFVAGRDNLYEDNSDPDDDFAVRVEVVEEGLSESLFTFYPNITRLSTVVAGRQLIDLDRRGSLTAAQSDQLFAGVDPEKTGETVDYVLENGDPLLALDLIDGLADEQRTAVFERRPELGDLATDPTIQQLRAEAPYTLRRLLVEAREEEELEGESADFVGSEEIVPRDVAFQNTTFIEENQSAGNMSTGFQFLRGPGSGVGYDNRLEWKKLGGTGMGVYRSLSVTGDGSGDVVAVSSGGTGGTLWKKQGANHLGSWRHAGRTLPGGPYQVVDAAIDPTDEDHIYAIATKEPDTFGLYETDDGGATWHEVQSFAQQHVLKDDEEEGRGELFKHGAKINMFPNGRLFVYNYEHGALEGVPGDFALHLQGKEAITRDVNLSEYDDVTVTYWEFGDSFDGAATRGSEDARFEFYNGLQWLNGRFGGERWASQADSFGWRKKTADIPDDWLDEDNKIRFKFRNTKFDGCCLDDHWLIDNITVTAADPDGSGRVTVVEEDWEDKSLGEWRSTGKTPPSFWDEDEWVYYSPDGGQTWQTGDINTTGAPEVGWVNKPGGLVGGHYADNTLSFADSGVGVLMPYRKILNYTTDYGETWEGLGNYSQATALTHDVARDGTIYVAYTNGSNEHSYLHEYNTNGERVNEVNLSQKGFPTKGGSCAGCVQVMAVEPGDPSHLTIFVYSDAPYESRDGGDTWTRMYDNKSVATTFGGLQAKRLRTGSPPVDQLPKPTDVRDMEFLDEVGRSDMVLLGSDQGLWTMKYPSEPGHETYMNNIGATLDHSQAGNVVVDECGNVYQGAWHAGAMLRKPGDTNLSQEITNPSQRRRGFGPTEPLFHMNYQNYWFGGVVEANSMLVKDRTDCAGFFAPDSQKGQTTKLSPYGTGSSGTLQKEKPDAHPGDLKTRPTFFDGRWFYVNRSTNNLTSFTLGQPVDETVKVEDVSRGSNQKDRVTRAGGGTYLWFETKDDKALKFWRNSRSGTPQESLDLSGSDYVISDYDVANGRVAVNVTDPDKGISDVFTYDVTATSGTLDEDDVGDVTNPFSRQFGDVEIRNVYADPTRAGRYYAEVEDVGKGQCYSHIMVTENGGDTWQRFSRVLDCKTPYNFAFNRKSETMFVSINGRGVFRGNLSAINEDKPNVGTDIQCEDSNLTERGQVTCTVTLESSGDLQEWRDRGEPQLVVDLPWRTLRYSIPGFRQTETAPFEQARCFVQAAGSDVQAQNGRLECDDPLRNFPASQQVSFTMDLRKIVSSQRHVLDPVNATVTARLNFTRGPPDPNGLDNRDNATLTVFPTTDGTDRLDRGKTRFARVITPNDNFSAATPHPIRWSHPPEQHLACPGDRNANCSGLLTNSSEDAPSAAVERWSATVPDLGIGRDPDFFEIRIPESVPLVRDKPTCGTFETRISGSTDTSRVHLFTLDASYRQYFHKPASGPHLDVAPPLERAFENHTRAGSDQNISLSDKSFIKLPDDVSSWDAGQWIVRDRYDWQVEEQPDGSLRVYSLDAEGTTVTENRTIATDSRLIVNVTGHEISVPTPFGDTTRFVPVNTASLQPHVYTASNVSRDLAMELRQPDSGERLSIIVDCPREKNLAPTILSLGESLNAAGGYNLSLTYRINLTHSSPDLSVIDIGQYDTVGVELDPDAGWQRAPVDVEELERKIAVSEIGVNPDPVDPPGPEPDPGPPMQIEVSTRSGPVDDTPRLETVLEADGGHPYIQVQHDRTFEGQSELTVEVSDETLEQNDVGADRVALHRYDAQNGWEQVDTEHVGSTGDGQRYTAQFQGLSLFAVGTTVTDRETARTAPDSVGPGGEVTVTVTANASDGSAVTVQEFFQPAVASASVERVAVDGEPAETVLREADTGGIVVTVADASVDAGDTVTVEYTVSVAESAELGSTVQINGSVISAETTDLGIDRLTVREQGPVAQYDSDDDGTIDITELGVAAGDYVVGELSIVELGDVAAEYAQS